LRKPVITILIICLWATLISSAWSVTVRLKDIAEIEGVRSNPLVGYGLVIGLNKTGDGNSVTFTRTSISNMLERLGVTVSPDDIKGGNTAAAMVTAELPPFSRRGNRIDVLVSSIGDAKSLLGGTLLMTPLKAADGQVYAVAQGAVSVGGYMAGDTNNSVTKNHPTVGIITNGALVEKEVEFAFNDLSRLTISLNNNDFATTLNVAEAINTTLGERCTNAIDPRTLIINIPQSYRNYNVNLVAAIENIEVTTDSPAKVVINERTGTVIMGEHLRLGTVAISHGNLHIQIRSTPQVSQPNPFTLGNTTLTQKRDVKVTEEDRKLFVVESGASLGDLVKALNAIGVTPRDLIAILQAVKAAGALPAHLEVM